MMKAGLKSIAAKLVPVPSGTGLLGLSGGADSVALMVMLNGFAGSLQLKAVHVNHGLRGEESDHDEEFVRDICGRYHVELHVYHPDLKGKADENTAREARFACFRDCMEKTGADVLILAHQADDQAETFMMRLLRGAGPEGLGCMKSVDYMGKIRILRPMLNIRREEIRSALAEAGIPWREDSSNTDRNYLRNNLRLRLMPLMEEMIPGASVRIAGTARLISDENAVLEEEASGYMLRHAGKRWIDVRHMSGMVPALRRRIMRRWWQENAPQMKEHSLNAEQTDRLVKLTDEERGKVNLPGGLYAVRGRQAIHMTGFEPELIPETPVSFPTTEFGRVTMEVQSSAGNPGDGKTSQEMPLSYLSGCVIRTRREGDLISPFGMSGIRKLQDYLTDRKVDKPWRDSIPLLCRGNEVLLVAGVGAGNIPGWNREENNIRICWCGEMPWLDVKPEGEDRYEKNRRDLQGPGPDSRDTGGNC